MLSYNDLTVNLGGLLNAFFNKRKLTYYKRLINIIDASTMQY